MSLFDSSSKGVKFDVVGATITGTVKAPPRERQQTKFGTQEPDFWPNGDPKMQILVDLQTTLQEDGNDDGERTLYVASKNMKTAISQAIRAANAADILPGGTLTITYIGNNPASKNPANPAKLYQAQYSAPAGAFATPAPAVATPAAVPSTPAPAAPVAAPVGVTPEQAAQIAQLRAAGIQDQNIAAAVGVSADVLANIPF